MMRFLFFLVGAAALAQQVPVPPLAVPAVTEARSMTRTNANGDLVITTIIPKPKEEWRHYYGIANVADKRIEYIGQMTLQTYQTWANQGTTFATGGPQVQRWICIFSTTNQIDAVLNHAKVCL